MCPGSWLSGYLAGLAACALGLALLAAVGLVRLRGEGPWRA